LTGKDNYKSFSDYLKKPEIMDNPDLVANEYAFESALFFFDKNKLWNLCNTVDANSILRVSKAINLGNPDSPHTPIGLDDRTSLTNRYYSWLKQ
jgi:putative chitinase